MTVRIPFADETLDPVVFSVIKDNGSVAPNRKTSVHGNVFRAIGCAPAPSLALPCAAHLRSGELG